PARDQSQEMVAAERPRGVFSRQLFLGENLDTDNIEATTNLSPSRQASMGITAGRAAVPRTCCAKRSSSRNGSVRINIVSTSTDSLRAG
ncbi:Hsp20 family protein, partial [Rhodococcus sp. YH1]|uniref:Hsp20 family protein n=1 Tax=Rhodococcus sp. YH1 TaxID=89066 RepID=UPI003FD3387F